MDYQKLIEIARASIEHQLQYNTPLEVNDSLKSKFNNSAGVFVTLRKPNGDLRGCIGTIEPIYSNLAQETARNAVSAAFSDPRFPEVTQDDYPGLTVEVSILEPPENIDGEAALDPKRYGVIVKSKDGRRGLLLPDIEGIDSVAEQVSIAKRKAQIGRNEPVQLMRFLVTKVSEDTP